MLALFDPARHQVDHNVARPLRVETVLNFFAVSSPERAWVIEAYRKALRYGTTLAVIAFLCIQLFPLQILSIFGSEDPLFYEFSIHYIRIYLLMTFVNAFQPITSNFFTSIGKAKLGFWMALVRQGLLLIPLLLLLPLALGMDGVLWAGPISDGVAAVLVLVLGAREVRRLTVQQEETP